MRPISYILKSRTWLVLLLKGFILGDVDYLENQYRELYGVNQEEKARHTITRNRKRCFAALLSMLVLLVSFFLGQSQSKQHYLYRSAENQQIIGLIRPESGMIKGDITARIVKEDSVWTGEIPARIPSASMMEEPTPGATQDRNQEEALRRQVESLLREAIAEPGSQILLPTHTRDGIPIQWLAENNRNFGYLFLGILLLGGILASSRYSALKKERAAASRSIEGDLPLFLNQLVLLLNAGAIFEGAFKEIMKNEQKKKEKTYFYSQLELILIRYEETRDPLDVQLAALARRTDDQDFIRIAGIIRDNLQRGILLSEKLLKERNDLMHKRKKRVEEEIRVKETKLTMPLCLYLLVLITIAIAPAVLTS